MNDMWTALETYQPYAERHGFGAEWLKMTTERTADAARAAAAAAAGSWAEAEAFAAAAEAYVAGRAGSAEAEAPAARAIRFINEAIELEELK